MVFERRPVVRKVNRTKQLTKRSITKNKNSIEWQNAKKAAPERQRATERPNKRPRRDIIKQKNRSRRQFDVYFLYLYFYFVLLCGVVQPGSAACMHSPFDSIKIV